MLEGNETSGNDGGPATWENPKIARLPTPGSGKSIALKGPPLMEKNVEKD